MSDSYKHKNGLLYSDDGKTLVGIDSESTEFTGRVPYGAHIISADAFAGCNVKEISIPDSVKSLPDALFENLTEVETVKLPDSLGELPPYLFSGCASLKKVRLPAEVTAFPEGLFNECESLQEIPFKENIQELPENVFAGCSDLKSVIIPNAVSKIHKHAFRDCTSLEVVVIPAKLYELEDDAFEGCNAIRTIRVDPANHLFYTGEDGNLYEKNIDLDGEDILRLKIASKTEEEKSYLEENPESEETGLDFISTEEIDEDDTFSSEISASEDELSDMGMPVEDSESVSGIVDDEFSEEKNMVDESETKDTNIESEENMSEVDSIFADIMSDEKERTAAVADVSVSESEVEVLSQAMEVMADAAPASGGAITNEELEKLFASQEAKENASNAAGEESSVDSKTQILVNSVEFSRVIETGNGAGSDRDESDLFVIAENLIVKDTGDRDFSSKLLNCAEKIARIQDFKRIILLKGLPLDNDEFMQFYYHFINKKNVILACAADSAAALSDYCKKVCEQSRISLVKDDLAEQRRSISIKNDSLVKLVIQDIYE